RSASPSPATTGPWRLRDGGDPGGGGVPARPAHPRSARGRPGRPEAGKRCLIVTRAAYAATMAECLEVARPWRLLRTAGWSIGEAAGIPLAAYLGVDALAGRAAGVLAGLIAVWLVLAVRKLATGSVPGLLMISALLLCAQTALVLATGQ